MTIASELSTLFYNAKWAKDFTQEDVQVLASKMTRQEYKEGERIISIGDTNFFLSFIVSGNVMLKKDYPDTKEKGIVTLSPNTFFGEISLVDGLPRSASAFACEHVVLLNLPKNMYTDLLLENPPLGIKLQQCLLFVISRRLRLTTIELVRRM